VQVGVLLLDSVPLALAFAFLSRAAYIGYVAVVLRRQDRDQAYSRKYGPEPAHRRFRAVATVVMNNDAVAIGLACWAGRGTFEVPGPAWVPHAAGAALAAVGVGIKTWAARSLPDGAFTWRSFFVPPTESKWVAVGPYRWLSNPMYTLGYLHAWGLALALRSVPGLIASGVAQSAILLLQYTVERPHTERMRSRTMDGGDSAP
jgi:protein-S-isoprenylcysteine O-methyltransferase Ste14